MKKLILVCVLAASLLAAHRRAWQEGHVIDVGSKTQTNGAYAAPLGAGAIALPVRVTFQYYVIRSKTVEYIVAERAILPANILVNGYVDFAIERGKFYFVDMSNFEHTAVITRQTLITNAP